MPKPRKTYERAELDGSAAVNKGRYAARASAPPTTGTIGSPPDYFLPAQKAVWSQVVAAIPPGVAGSADCFMVEIAARFLHEFRTDLAMSAARITILANVLSRLGLDPQARTKLLVGGREPKPQASPIERFMAAMKESEPIQ